MQDEVFMRKAIELPCWRWSMAMSLLALYLSRTMRWFLPMKIKFTPDTDPTFHGEAGLIREFCAQTGITDLQEYTMYSSCEPCFMCSGAMVWVKLGRLVYAASNMELEKILGNEGCNCSKMVFDNSFWQPQITAGVLREESLVILNAYFEKHEKG